jgi:hypothetical protein
MAMIMATVLAKMYISVCGKIMTGYGEAVGSASTTTNALCACDGQ